MYLRVDLFVKSPENCFLSFPPTCSPETQQSIVDLGCLVFSRVAVELNLTFLSVELELILLNF